MLDDQLERIMVVRLYQYVDRWNHHCYKRIFDKLNEIDDILVIEEILKMEKIVEMNIDTHALKEFKSRKKNIRFGVLGLLAS